MTKIHYVQSGATTNVFSVLQRAILMRKVSVFKLTLFVKISIQNKENAWIAMEGINYQMENVLLKRNNNSRTGL